MLWISKSNNQAMIKIYTDWANHHLEKTGVKSVIQDLPKDISDGVLLADIVHFVCGEHVERIHSKPTTAKEKLHNIDRCLKVLESHRVVLNDVTAQGLYRRELKCVLALFFHLSRFKQKGEQFKMADCKSTPRRTLRPPTAVSVSRKSKSFNANDRTRINPVSEPPNANNDEPPANSTDAGWRSKSMSTKHSATTRLVAPKTHTNSLQKSKLGSPASNVQRRPPSSGSGTLEKKSKLATNSSLDHRPNGVSRSAKLNGHAKPVPPTRVSSHDPERTLTSSSATSKHVTSSNPPSRHVTSSVAASNRRPEARSNAASTRSNVEPKSVTSSTRNHTDVTSSSTSRTKLQAPSTQTRNTQLKRPEGKSVFSRIKKLGSATPSETTSSKSVTSSAKSRSTSPAEKSAASKKRAESCPPTSRTLSAAKPRPQNLGTTLERQGDPKKSKLSTLNKNGLRSPSGLKSVKSSFGKAFGKSPEKRKSPMTEKPAAKTPETPSSMEEALPPPLPPRTPLDVIDTPPRVNVSKTLPREKQPQVHHEPVSISLASPRPTSKPQKTATVAPFIRHPSVSDRDRPQDLKEEIPPPKPEIPQTPTSSVSTPKSDVVATSPAEAREQAVKGIADLRHNLEETMSSLRNTQLRHKKGDAFERRLSAHLDGEYDEIVAKLPDIPPALMSSNALCRSQNNLLTFRQSVHSSSNSPKLHAGETLGHDSRYKFAPGRFSSLQRTRSARYNTRRAWHDVTAGYVSEGDAIASPDDEIKETFDDASSLSSCDISECIADVSTDEFSSAHNSPFRKASSDNKSITESTSRFDDALTNMAVEGNGKSSKFGKKKGIGKPPSGKPGLKAPGSSVVGSRLACNTMSQSPTNNYGSPLQSIAGQRGTLAYRSLPRPSKARFQDDKPSQAKSKMDLSAEKSAMSTFKRSPSLQKLLSLQSKTKQQQQQQPVASEQEPMTSSEPPAFVYTNPNVTSPTPTTLSLSTFSSNSSPLKYDRSQYNSLGRRKGSSPRVDHSCSSSPLSYMSLPRKPRATSSQSESPKPPLASLNSSYMSMNLLTTPSLYLDETSSIHETDELFKEGNRLSYRGDVSDWPLPTLHSSDVAASSPNVARSAKSVSQSTHSLQQQRKSGRSQSLMASTPSLLASQPTKNGNRGDIHSQLNTSAKVVSAFEESLSTMNCRLRELSVSAEQKDSELQELRATIESLKHNQSPDEWSSTTTSNASKLKKKASCGSLSSISSKASVSSMGSGEDARGRKKKHWLKESLKTAFGKRKSRPNLSVDLEEADFNLSEAAGAASGSGAGESDVVAKLKEELLQKERKLTDIRLEALTSQHQLHQMQDAMQKMRTEMDNLRSENERLSRLGLSTMSLRSVSSVSKSMASLAGSQFSLNRDMTSIRLLVTLNFPQQMVHDDFDGTFPSCITIGACYVTRSVTWKELDGKVRQAFLEYCEKIDPVDRLGLDSGIVTSYTVGEVTRDVGVGGSPELLPCGYIVGNVDSVSLEISESFSVEMMALEMLTSRETIQRYCRLLLDHGRVMLSGPAGTGKTTLAKRLAEHIVRKVAKRGKDSIVYLDLKHRNENEIREYLLRLTEDCSKPESCAREIPVVLVLDDLQRSSSLGDAFHTLLTAAAHSQLPYLIGVVQQNQGPNLELHQEFRWILCSNHVPPVSEYLQRHLRKSLHVWETKSKCEAEDTMLRLVSWLPTCWKQINGCIESQNSADVTIGPRMFTPCPMEPHSSLTWFRDLWNFSIVPYVISAVKQGRKSTAGEWVDPLNWIKESWPWVAPCDLTPIRAEDVAHDTEGTSAPYGAPHQPQARGDPLLNMLMKLQEAAATNYESDTSHDDAFERSLDRALGDLS